MCLLLTALSTQWAAVALAQQAPVPAIVHPQALNFVGLYQLSDMQPQLTGTGVTVAVISRSATYLDGLPQNDYRPDLTHTCFADSAFTFHDNAPPLPAASLHTTAVCSILFGRDGNALHDSLGQLHYRGVAPDAHASIYEFWHFLTNNVLTNNPPEANVITASFGTQFEDWWTRGIDSMAQRYGLVIVAAVGNGANASDPVLYPAAGTNVIGVGVVNSITSDNPGDSLSRFTLAHPRSSSAGPTSDGRCKPDIVAPGNCLVADIAEPNRYRTSGDWSSFAAPIVAGTAALLIQEASQDPALQAANSHDGGNCLVKAVLLNSATKLPYWHKGRLTKDDDHVVPLDYVQGAGLLNAVDAYFQLIAGSSPPGDSNLTGWDIRQLDPNTFPAAIHTIKITAPADKFITATVCWNKNYGDFYPFAAQGEKDANLRLELWAVDTNNPDYDYLLDYSDSPVDNLEHIHHPTDPNYTDYEIIISYSAPPGVAATCALAWNVSPQPKRDDTLSLDLDSDTEVTIADAIILLDNILAYIENPNAYLLGDINSDGSIDSADLQIMLQHINPGTGDSTGT